MIAGDKELEIGVIGAGSWGTALAMVMAEKGHQVSLWVRDEERCRTIMEQGINHDYLPEVQLPSGIQPTSDLFKAARGKDFLFLSVPSHGVRETAEALKPHLSVGAILVNTAKGLEEGSYLRLSQVIEESLEGSKHSGIAALSGPNHAEEVSRKVPSATVVASAREEIAQQVQEVLMTPHLRVYTNQDLAGVEMGGALKNIIALASGVTEGLGLGDNTRAALLTRGLVEVIRLGKSIGAKERTFTGLSGLGDLFVTCSSEHSRNRKVGLKLGAGHKLEEVLAGMQMVAEGVKTTRAAYQLSQKQEVEMPITKELYSVLFAEKSPRDALYSLMQREKKGEVEDIAFDADS